MAKVAHEYAGKGDVELNLMLSDTYGADLTTLAGRYMLFVCACVCACVCVCVLVCCVCDCVM